MMARERLLCVAGVLFIANFAAATVINLDMNTTMADSGFTVNGTNQHDDITTNPGQLTMNIDSGSCYYNTNITDGLGSGEIITFGATITFDVTSTAWLDRMYLWSYKDIETDDVYYARMRIGVAGTTTSLTFGATTQNVATNVNDGQPHTFRIEIDKSTWMGEFYFDDVLDTSFTASVITTSGTSYSYISFGDNDNNTAAHTELWDNVFYSNEAVPEPTTVCLLSLGGISVVFGRKHKK